MLRLMTEMVIHACIKKLLDDADRSKEDDIEYLCNLFIAVGAIFDNPKNHSHINTYLLRMSALSGNQDIAPPIQNMLQVQFVYLSFHGNVLNLRMTRMSLRYEIT